MQPSHSDSIRVMLAAELVPHDDWQVKCISSVQEIAGILETIMTAMTDLGYPPKDIFGARLALDEAICNAIKHGHQFDARRVVEVRYCSRADEFLVEVEDQGPGFDPAQVPDATAPENLERPCGRGLLLIRHYATWVRHNRQGNCVTLCFCPSELLQVPFTPESLVRCAVPSV